MVWILLILCMTIQNHVREWVDLFYKENPEWILCLFIVVFIQMQIEEMDSSNTIS